MSDTVGKGVVKIGVDTDGLGDEISSKVKGESGPIGKAFGDLGKAAGAAFAATAAAGVAAFTGLAKIGASFDDASDKIAIATGATGERLKELQGSFKSVVSNVPVDFGEASTAIADLSVGLGLTGKPLEALSTQLLNLSRMTKTDVNTNVKAASDLFNDWGTTAAEQGPKLDELFRISQQTGVSVGDLAQQMTEGGVQFRQAGLTFEQTGSVLGLLGKSGLSVSDVLPALSRSMATAAKDGKDAGQVFRDTFDAIKNAPDDTAAAGIALDVFGAKAGPKFAALIREGKLSFDDMAKAISDGGSTIDETAKSTDDWAEKLKLLTNRVLVALEPVATKVFDAITKAVDWLTPYVERLSAWFGKHLPAAIAVVKEWFETKLLPVFQAVASWVVDHWPQISAVAVAVFDAIKSAISYFVDTIVPGAVEGFKAVFGWLMDHKEVLIGVAVAVGAALVALFVQWAAGAAAAAAATIAATAPFIAIGAAIAAVVAGVIYAYNHWQKFHDIVDAVGRFIRDTLWPIIQDVFGWLRDHVPPIVQGIIDKATWLWQNVLSPLADFMTSVFQVVWTVWKAELDIVITTVQALITAGTWLWNNVLSPLADFMTSVFQVVWTVWKAELDIVITTVQALITAATWLWNNVLSPITTFLTSVFNVVWSAVKLQFEAVTLAVQANAAAIGWLWNNVLSPVVTFLGGVFSAAWAAVKLIFEGVTTAVGAVSTAAGWLWNNVLSPLVGWIGAGFKTGMQVASDIFGGISKVIETVIGWIQKMIDKAAEAIGWLKQLNPFAATVTGSVAPGTFGPAPAVGKNAAGTSNWRGGLTNVNELGGEIMDLPTGTRIIPHDISMAMATAGTAGGSNSTVGVQIAHAEFNSGTDVDDVFRIAQFHMAAAA